MKYFGQTYDVTVRFMCGSKMSFTTPAKDLDECIRTINQLTGVKSIDLKWSEEEM